MNKAAIFFLVLLCLTVACRGQRIDFTKTFGGMGFEMDTVSLSMRQVLEVMRINPVAHDEFKKAMSYNTASSLFGFSGALLIAIPLVTAVAGGEPEWAFAAVGGAFTIASISLSRTFTRHAYHALDEYNRPFQSKRVQSELFITASGARLLIRF